MAETPAACRVCGAQASFAPGLLKNISGHRGDPIFEDRPTLTCSVCGSSWCTRAPTPAEIGAYYSGTYKVGRISDDELTHWPRWDTRSSNLITLGRMFGLFQPNDVFLDIGPGHGQALGMASQLLPSPRYACIEFNEAGIAFMRKALGQLFVSQSVQGVLDEYGEGGVRFVYSAHCFEHFEIEDLRASMALLRRLIPKDGVLSIEVPQCGAATFNRANNHVPHLIFFSRSGLTAFMESCGFEVKLCVGVWGQNPRARDHVAAHYGQTPAGAGVKHRLLGLNTGDWIAHDPGLVLKCVATPR